ncbi:hypothetical protein NDU88_005021 [Pleurodeles waltl]|uniref:Uncharacterized protein n=1 Tax=Pleurodeles waltl TaxID=8319 RepID=A0AAV7QHN3_PLEWA|nr:hypothetical protein NDU88_005021 [Pleurodeles waltl]
MDVGVVTASEGRVVIGGLVMEVVDEDVVHAGVSGDATGREVNDEEEEDTCWWIPVLLTQEGVPDHRCMLHNLALRRQVPFLQEDEAGAGRVAAVEPVDSDEEEAEEEDVDNRTTIIQQFL